MPITVNRQILSHTVCCKNVTRKKFFAPTSRFLLIFVDNFRRDLVGSGCFGHLQNENCIMKNINNILDSISYYKEIITDGI
jgi:hypothetical protein